MIQKATKLVMISDYTLVDGKKKAAWLL